MDEKTLVFILCAVLTKISGQDLLVVLPNGQIQGRVDSTYQETSYYAFEGIPYAAPPVGNLRFQAPQPPQNWDGTLNTTYLDIACYQLNAHTVRESEDCLFLNVYTPKISDELLPVMVYVYGGSYTNGWGFEYRPDLYIDSDVILVTLNYRLGIFGFLSTGDEVVPGNAGLKDQLLAFQWVKDNIKLFGGDPAKVTIFGQSAGGGSCAYHLLNQNAQGLFSRAIIESSTFLNQFSYQRNPRVPAFAVGAILNSTFETNEDSGALLEFLQSVDAEELAAATDEYSSSTNEPWHIVTEHQGTWVPVIEVENPTAVITKKMYGLLKSGNILPVPTMMGFTSEEFILIMNDVDVVAQAAALLDNNLDYLVPDDMPIEDPQSRTEMGTKIRDIYTNGAPLASNLTAVIQYCSDDKTTRPMLKHAELFANIAPTYFYQFSYDGKLGGIDYEYQGFTGVAHAEELNYIFCGGADCEAGDYPEEDLLTRKRLIKLWTNFAKYENPTPEPDELLQNVTWPQLSVDDGDFLYLDIGDSIEVKNLPRHESYVGWTQLYDSLDYDDFDTY